MSHTIEVSGILTKRESLVAVSSELSNNNLILETAHAFPGYHGIVPEEKVPRSLFLITKKKHSKESIVRSAMALRKYFKIKLDMVSSQITLQNQEVPAIRIKGLNNYNLLTELIQALYDEGYRFEKHKSISEFTSIIQVKKEFLLDEVEGGYYSDKNDSETHYFELEHELKWYAFEKVITEIKYNTQENNFDAALATFFRADRVVDSVRIYKKDIQISELVEIKTKLLDYLKS